MLDSVKNFSEILEIVSAEYHDFYPKTKIFIKNPSEISAFLMFFFTLLKNFEGSFWQILIWKSFWSVRGHCLYSPKYVPAILAVQ